jgi:hypothetical protein
MKQHQGKAAFSLVELAFAVGIASFALITILALLPAGISANQTSVEETEATGLMAGIIADLRSTSQPTSAAQAGPFLSPRYQIPIPRATGAAKTVDTLFLTEDGSLSGTAINTTANPALNPHFRVFLNFYPPGTSSTSSAVVGLGPTRVRVLVTWPALSDPQVSTTSPTTWPSKFSGSVETVVELNRNWLDH